MTSYHVTLGGRGLMLDLAEYRREMAAVFAPKEASGDRSYADQLIEQVWALSDWSGGQGFLEYDGDAPGRYRAGVGADGFTEPGLLQVGQNLQSSYASTNNALRVLQPFKGKLYAGAGDGKVYELSAGSWALSRDLAKAAGVTAMAVYGGKLHVANGTDNAVATYDGTTWTNSAYTATGQTFVQAMAVSDPSMPTLYLAGPGASVGEVRRWNGSTVSSLLFSVQEPSAGGLARLGTNLYLAGIDASGRFARIYRYDGSQWEPIADLPDNYPTVAAVFGGRIYYGCAAGGELWSFDGSSLKLVAADLTASGDQLRGLAEWRGALWVSARHGSELRVLRYDGSTWSTPIAGGSIDAAASAARGLAAYGGELYAAGEKAGASPIYKAAASGAPRTLATQLETVLFAAGLPSIDKVFRSVALTFAPLVSGQSIQAEYRLEDAGGWTSLGSVSTVDATSATFSFSGTVTGKLVALRLTLTATASASPQLYDVLLRYALAPALKRRWRLVALCEGTDDRPLLTLDGERDPDTGAEIAAALWTQAGTAGTKTLIDLDGNSYSVWLRELRERPAERSQRGGYSTRAELDLVEA